MLYVNHLPGVIFLLRMVLLLPMFKHEVIEPSSFRYLEVNGEFPQWKRHGGEKHVSKVEYGGSILAAKKEATEKLREEFLSD